MKRASPRHPLVPGGNRLFQRIYTRLGCNGRPPEFHVEFYPYANLTHTIRLRDQTAHVRLSDVLRRAPLPVLEAAAGVLLGRLYRRPVPGSLSRLHRNYSARPATLRRLAALRRARFSPAARGPRGAHHHLGPMFARLNRRYFQGALRRPALGWSRRPWRAQLGCYDPALDLIVISSVLDDARVPRYAVEYVLFHEMLHVLHPVRRARCGLQAHSPAFRREEKRFAEYGRARRFLARHR